ncbi:L,D-transpeptidase [Conservatibacter flavescens]|uniref:L,D-transpeptidase n=2 Tax=Conservatibacter flavescens TaxID=28161 RepID=A0A2M8S680_9PAST|nr:L,D-transpeptidase [Conservatibacter flavescens]
MYYSHNILKSAQQWLYTANAYRAKLPSEVQIAEWLAAFKSGEAFQFVKNLSSNNPLYLQTLERLAQMLPKDGKVQPVQYEEVEVVETVPAKSQPVSKGPSAGLTTTLYPGDVSQEVILLIRALKQRGYLKNHIDGQYYSEGVLAAVKDFQTKNGLAADGVVGANTRALLNGESRPQQKVTKVKKVVKTPQGDKVSTAQLYKLAINAQRLRVIPDFNDGIFVNIPSYQLQYYRDGNLVLQSRVIVGKDARRTPVMYSELSNVVVNPPWNTPARLVNEDIIPRARKDPSYLERRGYTILDKQGRAINPNSLDWSKIDPKKFPYRLRQRPGDSALGNYKFNMPSSDAIFLHDTPSRGLFNQKNRALSSGCVRVEKSDELATILLKEAGWSDSRKKNVLASKKTTSAPVKSHNPVYLYYVTAWVDNGTLHTLPDIYKYDVTPNLSHINWQTVNKYLL